MRRRAICLVVLILCLSSSQVAGTIHFRDGLTHNIDYAINDHVDVDYQTPYMYTTVNLLIGGSIKYPYELHAYNDSRINISGGSIDWLLFASDSSQVNITGGSIEYLDGLSSSQVTMSGGSISWHLMGSDNCQVAMSGGTIGHDLTAFGNSQVTVSGGTIGGLLIAEHDGILTIRGSNFAVDGIPFGYGELTSMLGGDYWNEPLRHLTGTLESGNLLYNDFGIGHGARIVLVPEPATVLLLGLGGLIVRKLKIKK